MLGKGTIVERNWTYFNVLFVVEGLMVCQMERSSMFQVVNPAQGLLKSETQPSDNIVFRRYEDGDEQQIVELFEKVFGRTMGPTESYRHWNWEYKDNPTKPLTIMLAWHGERLVGQYAGLPQQVFINGTTKTGALSLDSMTDPDYSRMGIFSSLGESLYVSLPKNQISFVYGFPNANVIHARTKNLNWSIISQHIPVYARPVGFYQLIRNRTNSNLLAKFLGSLAQAILRISEKCTYLIWNKGDEILVRKEKGFDVWANDLWAKCRDQHKIWVVRDLEYLQWRYNSRPETKYNFYSAWHKNEIAGYLVSIEQVRREGKVSFILDLLCDDKIDGSCDALLRESIKNANINGCSIICALVMPKSVYKSNYLKHFFVPLPGFLLPQKTFFGGKLICQDQGLDGNRFFDPDSWQICWGDTDLL